MKNYEHISTSIIRDDIPLFNLLYFDNVESDHFFIEEEIL
jgi:hypothetical protein